MPLLAARRKSPRVMDKADNGHYVNPPRPFRDRQEGLLPYKLLPISRTPSDLTFTEPSWKRSFSTYFRVFVVLP